MLCQECSRVKHHESQCGRICGRAGVIDRPALYRFFTRLKSPSGGFHVQDDGEMDTRGLYTVLAVASRARLLLKISTRPRSPNFEPPFQRTKQLLH